MSQNSLYIAILSNEKHLGVIFLFIFHYRNKFSNKSCHIVLYFFTSRFEKRIGGLLFPQSGKGKVDDHKAGYADCFGI